MSGAAVALTYLIAAATLVLVVVLVRRQRLSERYAITWVMLALGMVVLALARPVLDRFTQWLGIQSGVTTLLVLSLLVVLWVLLQLSVSVSRLERMLQDVAEAFALHTSESDSPFEEPEDD